MITIDIRISGEEYWGDMTGIDMDATLDNYKERLENYVKEQHPEADITVELPENYGDQGHLWVTVNDDNLDLDETREKEAEIKRNLDLQEFWECFDDYIDDNECLGNWLTKNELKPENIDEVNQEFEEIGEEFNEFRLADRETVLGGHGEESHYRFVSDGHYPLYVVIAPSEELDITHIYTSERGYLEKCQGQWAWNEWADEWEDNQGRKWSAAYSVNTVKILPDEDESDIPSCIEFFCPGNDKMDCWKLSLDYDRGENEKALRNMRTVENIPDEIARILDYFEGWLES